MGLLQDLLSGNPDVLFREMYRSNPQFKKFVDENKNKTAQEIMRDNHIDPDAFQQCLKGEQNGKQFIT